MAKCQCEQEKLDMYDKWQKKKYIKRFTNSAQGIVPKDKYSSKTIFDQPYDPNAGKPKDAQSEEFERMDMLNSGMRKGQIGYTMISTMNLLGKQSKL